MSDHTPPNTPGARDGGVPGGAAEGGHATVHCGAGEAEVAQGACCQAARLPTQGEPATAFWG